MRECNATLTPTLSLTEGDVSIPSPPEGERDRVRGSAERPRRTCMTSGPEFSKAGKD